MANNSNDENVQCNVFAFTQPILAEDGSGKYKLELYERNSNRFGGEDLLCKFYVYPSDWDRASNALRNLTREYNKHHSRTYIIRGDRKRIVESVKNRAMKTKEYFAGTIVLRDKVIVGDPCYPEIENVAVLNNVLEGTYNCFVKKGDIDGGRVTSIEVKHHQYQHLANEPFYIMEGGFGVDSGQAGIYDYGYHQEYHQFDGWILGNEGSKEQAWYNRIWVLTQKYDINNNHIEEDIDDFKGEQRGFAIMDNSALVSESGFGDGGYDIEVAKEDGFIKAIRVVFIDEENPYDDEDDYYEDNDEDC